MREVLLSYHQRWRVGQITTDCGKVERADGGDESINATESHGIQCNLGVLTDWLVLGRLLQIVRIHSVNVIIILMKHLHLNILQSTRTFEFYLMKSINSAAESISA